MFGLFKTNKKKKLSSENQLLAQEIKANTQEIVNSLRLDFQQKFEILSDEIHQLNQKLISKEIRDKKQYGHLHYKLHEVKNTKLEEEISDLEKKLDKII